MKRRIQDDLTIRQAFLGLALLMLGGIPTRTGRAEFWVALTGIDTATGNREQTFATLTPARDAARTAPAHEPRRIIVRRGN